MERREKLELMAKLKLKSNEEFYLVVNFLNQNLKSHNLMFGLAKKGDEMTFSIYEV